MDKACAGEVITAIEVERSMECAAMDAARMANQALFRVQMGQFTASLVALENYVEAKINPKEQYRGEFRPETAYTVPNNRINYVAKSSEVANAALLAMDAPSRNQATLHPVNCGQFPALETLEN